MARLEVTVGGRKPWGWGGVGVQVSCMTIDFED